MLIRPQGLHALSFLTSFARISRVQPFPRSSILVPASILVKTMSFRGYGSGRGRGRGHGHGHGRGRGRGRGRGVGRALAKMGYDDQYVARSQNGNNSSYINRVNGDAAALANFLLSITGSQYPRYKDLRGIWDLTSDITLIFDHVQSDAYASPSRARLRTPLLSARFPPVLHSNPVRTTAFCDFLTRKFWRVAHEAELDRRRGGHGWSGSKGGDITIDKPGQHVLQRTSCLIDGDHIELRFTVCLPARGRTIEGGHAAHSLTEVLPTVAQECLFAQKNDAAELLQHVDCIEDQEALRTGLKNMGLIAFIRNGAVLPRASGANDEPMTGEGVIEFESPPGLEVSFHCPSGRMLKGMGIKTGISLIVGGGFHGKSTLLSALEVGVYNHIPGDGRDFVVVHPDTVSIRAEDGRSVAGVDITPFINNLPFGRDTSSFSTPDASGSTSQAANIIEALEGGAKVLLTDEDLAATNFMMRDQRMARLVPTAKEPITPLIHRIRALYQQEGVSSILVVGGAGDYFEVSDLVVMMDSYKPRDVTKDAEKIAKKLPSGLDLDPANVEADIFKPKRRRRISPKSVQSIWALGKGRVSAKVKHSVQFGSEQIDVSAVSQIVELSQTRAIAVALEKLGSMKSLGDEGVTAAVKQLYADVDMDGLDAVSEQGAKMGNYARPRPLELQAALNRLRGIRVLGE